MVTLQCYISTFEEVSFCHVLRHGKPYNYRMWSVSEIVNLYLSLTTEFLT